MSNSNTSPSATQQSSVQKQDKSDAGYAKDLKPRHIQMIAIGGSIAPACFWALVAVLRKVVQVLRSHTRCAVFSRS